MGGRSCGARDEDKAPGRPTRRRTRDHLHPETVCIVRWPVYVWPPLVYQLQKREVNRQ